MSIEIILWDFGDTLVDQRWMLKELPGFSGWPKLFRDEIWEGELGNQWSRGNINGLQVARQLATSLSAGAELAMQHMPQCSRNIDFFPVLHQFSLAQEMPQAIVTVNPDIFTDVIVPHYELTKLFDPIVASWQERELNKADLCDITLERLSIKQSSALLIDNMKVNTDEWVERGGKGYWYRGESSFINDITVIL